MPMTTITRAYRTELDPTSVQQAALLRHCGAARWAYNWGLARKLEDRRAGRPMRSAISLHKELNKLKDTTFPWLREVSKCAPQEALRNLDRAFANQRSGKRGRKVWGLPRFKSRKRWIGSFRISAGTSVEPRRIRLPRIGWIRLKEDDYLPTNSRLLSVTVSERCQRWFVSVSVRENVMVEGDPTRVVGVDLGIRKLVTTSDNVVFNNPRALDKARARLRHAQRQLARKRRGSRNLAKAAERVARLYMRVANVRRDALHKITTTLTRTKSVIVIEDLHPSDMLRNRRIARALSDAAVGELRRQLEYKAVWYGSRIVVAPSFFPSSKRCACGGCDTVLREISLSSRTFTCPACGCSRDRDLNAALNLRNLAVSSTDKRIACGESVSPPAGAAGIDEAGTARAPFGRVGGERPFKPLARPRAAARQA